MFKRLFLGAFLSAQFLIAAELLEVNDTKALAHAPGAKTNQHAVIIHEFDANKSIIARAKVLATKGELAELELYTFADIASPSMSVPAILPSAKDKVVFDYLYENALLLSANESAYRALAAQIHAHLIDPELLAAQLYANGKQVPTRNDLRNFCASWAIGRIFFASQNELKSYDCASLEPLQNRRIDELDTSAGLNFYSAIAKPAQNFYEYFENLFNRE